MRRLSVIVMSVLALVGCATVQIPNYIKADHPYIRKISGDYDKIIAAIEDVLYRQGWKVQSQVNPSIYERRPGGEDQSRDVLFFTQIKQHANFFYSTYTHLNVFVHATGEGAEVEVRYGALNDLFIKKFEGTRNDPLAKRLLDKIEQELESK